MLVTSAKHSCFVPCGFNLSSPENTWKTDMYGAHRHAFPGKASEYWHMSVFTWSFSAKQALRDETIMINLRSNRRIRGEQSSVITEIRPKPETRIQTEPNHSSSVGFQFRVPKPKPDWTEPNLSPLYITPLKFSLLNHMVHNKN